MSNYQKAYNKLKNQIELYCLMNNNRGWTEARLDIMDFAFGVGFDEIYTIEEEKILAEIYTEILDNTPKPICNYLKENTHE
jgi:hypothetical protein